MQQVPMALRSGHGRVQQRAATVFSRPAKVLVQVTQPLSMFGRGVAAEGSNAEAGADEVDDDATAVLVEGGDDAGEMPGCEGGG